MKSVSSIRSSHICASRSASRVRADDLTVKWEVIRPGPRDNVLLDVGPVTVNAADAAGVRAFKVKADVPYTPLVSTRSVVAH
jgi:hypothetical protein